MRIKEIMNHPVVTCPVASTLDAIARLMWEFDCGIIPVVNDEGRLSGVITDRDICMAAYTQGRRLSEIPVTTAMSKDVFSAHSEDAVETVEHLMRANQIRRVPIVDVDNRPIGVVSMNDLARLAAKGRKSGIDRDVIQTMAAICRPRASADRLETNNIVTAVA
jgi:CBS domain-containing protein